MVTFEAHRYGAKFLKRRPLTISCRVAAMLRCGTRWHDCGTRTVARELLTSQRLDHINVLTCTYDITTALVLHRHTAYIRLTRHGRLKSIKDVRGVWGN
jgi:hypothetical protein